MLLSILADLCLALTHWPCLCLMVFVGVVLTNRNIMMQGVCLTALSILVNVALKGAFKIPLSPSLHKIGYAFPSGHMQLATVFYGWLACHIGSRVWCVLTVFGLMGVGFGLMYHGYHDALDILGGLLTGMVLIRVYQSILMQKQELIKKALWFTATLLMIDIHWVYTSIPYYAWGAYIMLLVLLNRNDTINFVKNRHLA